MTAVPSASYMRIVSFAIAAFDMLQTMPAEYRLYKLQFENRRISPVCAFFIINRYFGAAALATNGIGFFSSDFDQPSCEGFYQVPPTLKLIATLGATAILFIRTWIIARRSKMVLIVLTIMTLILVPILCVSNYLKRFAVVSKGNCTSTRRDPSDFNWAPIYYLACLLWDLVACIISTYYLISQAQGMEFMAKFTRRVLKHGVLYCFGATMCNLLVFLSILGVKWINGLGATVNIAVTMILCQHLVLSTYKIKEGTSTNDTSEESRSRSRSLSTGPNARSPAAARASRLTLSRPTHGHQSFTPSLVSPRSRHHNRGLSSFTNNRDSGMELGAVKITTMTTTVGDNGSVYGDTKYMPEQDSEDDRSRTTATTKSPTTPTMKDESGGNIHW